MSDLVVDSSVVAKWFLPEVDSPQAQRLLLDATAAGDQLIVLDLALPEVANAIWKSHRQKLIALSEAETFLRALAQCPVKVQPAARLLDAAFKIAVRYDRAIYDALFLALAVDLGIPGVTADGPLYNVVRGDMPQITLLANRP